MRLALRGSVECRSARRTAFDGLEPRLIQARARLAALTGARGLAVRVRRELKTESGSRGSLGHESLAADPVPSVSESGLIPRPAAVQQVPRCEV